MKRITFFILFFSLLLNGLTLDSSNVRTFSRWPYTHRKMSLQLSDTVAIISLCGGLWFINISNPQNPVKIKEYITDGDIRNIILDGEILYIPDPYLGLRVFDISSLDSIEEIGRLIFPNRGFFPGYSRLFIKETLAFAGNWYLESLEVIDIRDPRNPQRIGVCYRQGGGVEEIFVEGGYAYIAASWGGLKIFDVSNPSSPYLVSEWRAEDGGVTCVTVKDTFAYVANYDTLHIINVSNPRSPREVGKLRMLTPSPLDDVTIYDLLVVDTLLYAGVGSQFSPQVINVSNPFSPYHIYHREDKFVYWGLQLRWPLLFGLSGFLGLVIYDITNPTSWEVLSTFGLPSYAVQVMPANDSLIVIGTSIHGLFLLDITDPLSPRDRGGYPVKFSYNPYDTLVGRLGFTMGLAVRDTFLFAGGLGSNCLHILNFSNPDSIRRVALCTVARGGPVPYKSGVRSLFLRDSLIYVGLNQGSGGQGLVICDVKNPLSPRVLGRVELRNVDMYGLQVIGNICYGAGGNGGFFIFDVSDPRNPYVRGHIPPYSTWGYVNDVWVRDTFAYLAESFDGVGIVKVKDPANPRRITQNPAPGQCLGIHGFGNLLFIACGFGGGLRVWDISDPINPREAGYYLTGGGPNELQYRNGIIHTCGDGHGYRAFEYYGAGVEERGNGESLWFECLPTVGKKFIIRSPFKRFYFYIYDAQGRLVLGEDVNKRETSFSLNGKPEGVYFLLIRKEGKSLLRRVINLK